MTTTTSASLRPLREFGASFHDAPTTEFMMPHCIAGDTVLNIRPPALQNIVKIPRERAFLAHGRINAPPHPHQVAKIGVGIGILS